MKLFEIKIMVFFYKEVINAEEKKKKCGELKTVKLLLL